MTNEITERNINELIEYATNPREIGSDAVDKLAAMIHEFGFRVPIIAKSDGLIVDGHLRLLAAKKLGMTKVPCLSADDMSVSQIKAFRIAVNKAAEFAAWDDELLAVELQLLKNDDFDMDLIGFEDGDIDALITEFDAVDEGLTDEDAVPAIVEEPVTVLGDVWTLGNHRLMCGDSTSIDAVEKLMDGKRADFGFCDPPYNFGFEYNSYDDNKSDCEYVEFSNLWFSNLQSFTDRQAVTLGTKNITIMASLGEVSGVACWVKKNWITSCKIAKLQQWEPIFFYGDYTKLKRNSDLFEINRRVQTDVGDNHTCPKQIELILDIYSHYSIGSVLDLFQGSGTSIIACEKLNKKCFGMELDPRYCDVIIKRYFNFTGKTAILESTGQTFQEVDDER